MLGGLPRFDTPDLLVGNEGNDDAGVFRVAPDLALVQSVDFFTPVVDDPYDFGAVAAANAFSDIYAMGAKPITALNIVGFPVNSLSLEILREILRGGCDKAVEAGVAVLGGHSIEDAEPKFGMAVTGVVHPERVITNAGGRPGDVLVLTKPLGIGILTTGIKRGRLDPAEIRDVVELMTTLNRAAGEAAREAGAHAMTDITGYGFLGHTHELAHASGLAAHLGDDAIPLLTPRVTELAEAGVVPGGSKKNLAFIESRTTFDQAIPPVRRLILADAQTSGGLLVAVAPERAGSFCRRARELGVPVAVVVGRLVEGEPGRLVVEPGSPRISGGS